MKSSWNRFLIPKQANVILLNQSSHYWFIIWPSSSSEFDFLLFLGALYVSIGIAVLGISQLSISIYEILNFEIMILSFQDFGVLDCSVWCLGLCHLGL